MVRIVLRAFGLLAVSLLLSAVAGGQGFTGTPPFASMGGGPFDSVNEGNLNVHFQIPIINKQGRGLPFSYVLTYDSSMWSNRTASGSYGWTPSSSWGWGAITTANTGYVTYTPSNSSCGTGQGYYQWTNYVIGSYFDPFGTVHAINTDLSTWTPGHCGGGAPNSATLLATDGSGYTFALQTNGYGSTPLATVYSRGGGWRGSDDAAASQSE